jgi:hypothetical protein
MTMMQRALIRHRPAGLYVVPAALVHEHLELAVEPTVESHSGTFMLKP